MAARKTHKPGRVYSDDEKARALVVLQSNRGNITRTARQLDLARKTLESWSKGTKGVSGLTPELMAEKTTEVVEKLDRNIDLYLEAAQDPDKIKKASLKDVNLSLAIAVDKRQLLTNRPTSITHTSQSNEQRLLASIKQVMAECAAAGVEIGLKEAATLLKEQLPDEAVLLDRLIEGELLETIEVKGLIEARAAA